MKSKNISRLTAFVLSLTLTHLRVLYSKCENSLEI